MITDNEHFRCLMYALGTFFLCLAVSAQTALYVYKASTEHTREEIRELRHNIPPPLFKAQVERIEGRVRDLEKHHERHDQETIAKPAENQSSYYAVVKPERLIP